MLYAFGKELRRVLQAPQAVAGIEDAELAVLVSQAIAALPDDGSWLPIAHWRRVWRAAHAVAARSVGSRQPWRSKSKTPWCNVSLLRWWKQVRRRGRHFVAQTTAERQALALEFCALFLKGLLDKLALPDMDTGTYLRNHYLHIDPARLPEFRERLEATVRTLVEEYATDASAGSEFFNILITATLFEGRACACGYGAGDSCCCWGLG